ncbi:competence damage-inducible protein A [Candidatus Bathyarchaeota archaeon]|nr:competence damage-inducible protein A [Candidatus Bathyarchaeota archaeon]
MVDLEIICVGNELLIGKILNTNSHWLAKQATILAVNVKRVTVIQDTVEEIAKTVCEALERKPQFIITTGGLGPTFDDKTLEGIAKALDRKLEVNQKALEMVKTISEQYARKRGLPAKIELTKPRVKMATLPLGAAPVNNPDGTAPGVMVNHQGTVLFALPGVPSEMEAIFCDTIAPMLRLASGNLVFCEKSLFADDIAESTLAPLIDKTMINNKGVYIKSHPMAKENRPHIELHLTITVNKEDTPDDKLNRAVVELSELIRESGGKPIIENSAVK